MKTIQKIAGVLLLCLFGTAASCTLIHAHAPGQPQVVMINGRLPASYFDPFIQNSTSLRIPDELVIDRIKVGTSVSFLIDRKLIPLPPNVLDSLQFQWDFGDDSKTEIGDAPHHTYNKTGSYVVKTIIIAKDQSTQPLQTMWIHIVPEDTYTLPNAKIAVNGSHHDDLNYDIAFGIENTYDSKSSGKGSAPIVSSTWTFDPETKKTGDSIPYSYDQTKEYGIVVLQIQDANGLISQDYAYMGKVATPAATTTVSPQKSQKGSKSLIFLGLGIVSIIVGWVAVSIFRSFSAKRI
ncbi:MAG: PKD domain-containing protein [Candidatus Woesebacteria bacterium]